MKFLLATGNRHKRGEFASLLSPHSVGIVEGFEVEEDGTTYAENALKKLEALRNCRISPGPDVMFADDSGFEVDALHGEPGLYSSRFMSGCGQREKNSRILELLEGVKDGSKRSARFICTLAFAAKGGKTELVTGVLEGHVAFAEEGSGGFGYDPIFIPDGQAKSLAALGSDFKNSCSHRSRAAALMLASLGLR